jgi:serine/threonine-protein kinase
MIDHGEPEDTASPPLTPDRWSAVDAVLQGALARTPPERGTYLAEACAGDVALRREVESLLAVAVSADDFLERPAIEDTTAAQAVVRATAMSTVARLSDALAGRYTIERELARGGTATVYLARDLRHKRLVALKVLDPRLGTLVGPSRFAREIETAAGLSHPHILPLHDSGAVPAGRPDSERREGEGPSLLYYVMPYVAGASLRERLRQDGALAVPEALRIVREVAAALDYAHRHGVVHRDIKPENILIGEDGDALVADFGIACALEDGASAAGTAVGAAAGGPDSGPDTLTQWGAVVGTPAYMSPEQALGAREIDGRTDQYSLACVAFELLAGFRPFTGSTAEQLARRPTQEPPSLAAWRPELAPAADAVLTRALAPVPEARFASVPAFAYALAEALVGRGGGAAPGGLARDDRATTRVRRLTRNAGVVAAVVLTAAAGTVLLRVWVADPRSGPSVEGTGPVGRPVDPEALDLYLKGTRIRYEGVPGRAPADYFARAIARDSAYAPAYAGLAFEHTFNGDTALARWLIEKAVALDSTLAEAHMVRGVIRQFLAFDLAGAEDAFREAIRLKPGYAEAHLELSMLLMRRRRFDDALQEAQQAVYLAPMSARFEIGLAEVYLYSGRYDEALIAADRALSIDSSHAGSYLVRAYAYGEQRRYREAADAAMKCIALGWDVTGRAILGHIHARSGRRQAALQIVDSLQTRWREGRDKATAPNVAIGVAQVYAGLGERARALDWLERGAGRAMYVLYLGIDPTFRALYPEPRFRRLLNRVGLDG